MSLTSVRTKASLILSVVALAQVMLLGFSLGLLILKLRNIRTNLIRQEKEAQLFLKTLGNSEGDLYRTSILLRDNIILEGAERLRAKEELVDLLRAFEGRTLQSLPWMSAEMLGQVQTIESAKREYLARARTILDWQENERKMLGPKYLSQQLAPMRKKFVFTAREIETLIQSLRESRNQATDSAIASLQSLAIQMMIGAAVLGLSLVGVAIWRFTHYERERDVHMQHLSKAEESLRALSLRLVDSQELERKKISRELHDEVGQILTALRVQIGQIHPADKASKAHLDQASELADRSLRTVREMARGLRPAMLDDLGLAPALKWLGRDFSKHSALDVEVQIEGEFQEMDEQHRTCLYRVVQEALTNCVKHSECASARVLLHESPDEVVLTVQDNGSGFIASNGVGIGLLGMRERIEELGGVFTVISSPGAGTLIRANIPKQVTEES